MSEPIPNDAPTDNELPHSNELENAAMPARKDKQKPKDGKKKQKKKNGKKAGKATSAKIASQPAGSPEMPSKAHNENPVTGASDNLSEAVTAVPQTILNLPVKPDEWFIKPATHDESGNIITEETFIFLKEGIEVISMPLTGQNFSGLYAILTERFQTTDDASREADYFHIRKPLAGSAEVHPVMTLTQHKRILATTTLDQPTLKQLIRALQVHVDQRSPVTTWMKKWWKKHKILRVLLVILLLPFALAVLYSVIWGFMN